MAERSLWLKRESRRHKSRRKAGLFPAQRRDYLPDYLNILAWLPFLNTYRTMCQRPKPDFQRALEEIRDLHLAA